MDVGKKIKMEFEFDMGILNSLLLQAESSVRNLTSQKFIRMKYHTIEM